jgi:hypothetical protein
MTDPGDGIEDAFVSKLAVSSSKNDFNNDGQGDILWRNYANGKNAVWYMDYSGEGMAGLSLINFEMMDMIQGPGQTEIYQDPMEAEGFPNKSAVKVYWSPMEVGDLGYKKEASEFDWEELGDAREIGELTGPVDVDDMKFRIQEFAITGSEYFYTVTDTNWHIAGTGDFNGDGQVDMIWRNYSDGKDSVWYMNGMTRVGSAYFLTITDTNWHIAGTGDLNGDGQVDMIWRNYSDGKNAVWYMSGMSITGSEYFLTITDTNWKIENH